MRMRVTLATVPAVSCCLRCDTRVTHVKTIMTDCTDRKLNDIQLRPWQASNRTHSHHPNSSSTIDNTTAGCTCQADDSSFWLFPSHFRATPMRHSTPFGNFRDFSEQLEDDVMPRDVGWAHRVICRRCVTSEGQRISRKHRLALTAVSHPGASWINKDVVPQQ